MTKEYKIIKIKSDKDCEICDGTGIILPGVRLEDGGWVERNETFCACVKDQMNDD